MSVVRSEAHMELSPNVLPHIGDANLRKQTASDILRLIDQFNDTTDCGQKGVDDAIAQMDICRTIFYELVSLRDKLVIAARNDVPVWGPKGINPILKRLRTGKSFDVATVLASKPSAPLQEASRPNPPFAAKSDPLHLSFLFELRGNNEYVPTRALSLEQRGMIIDYYETLTGYGKKGDFLRRYGIRKELILHWKDQVRRFRALVLQHVTTPLEQGANGVKIHTRDDELFEKEEKDVQQFAEGDRVSFVRAYGTDITNVFEAARRKIYDFVPEEHPDDFHATDAMPGSTEKIDVFTDRVRKGHPLWHPKDRGSYDDNCQE